MERINQGIARVFKAMGDENRLTILMMLKDGERCACKLQETLQISQPTLSHHMRILQDAYNTDDKADFYNYTRSLDALKASMTGGSKTVMLDKDSELARILYGDFEG
jgi:DNA-binding transcriptional ArsR family regulator